jgi:hypothetical protein
MWRKDLLFCSLVIGGLALLAVRLLPEWQSPREGGKLAFAPTPSDLLRSVDRLNEIMAQRPEMADVTPAGRTDDLTIARRLSLGLTGTIPSLEEIRRLEAHPAEDRLSWWTQQLLSDRRYSDYLSERLARAWVGVDEGQLLLFRRRRFVSWVADELHANRPYDALVREVISAEGLWTDRPATNFITAAIAPGVEKEGPNEIELAGRVTRAFLGIRLDCAECHDHPFADWKQSDFQGLAAFFGRAETTLMGIREKGPPFEAEDHATGISRTIEPAVPFEIQALPPPGGSDRIRLARWVTDRENRSFPRATVNRIWAVMFGQPLVEPIDDIPMEDDCPAALDFLANDFAVHGYDLKRLIRVIAASDVFQRDSRTPPPKEQAEAPEPGLSEIVANRSDAGMSELAVSEVAASHGSESEDALPEANGSEVADPELPAWAVFPLRPLRPEQVVGAVIQSGSLETIDYESHIVFRTVRLIQQNEFLTRYGDAGSDELEPQTGTISQRLLLLNGKIVKESTDTESFNTSGRIDLLAEDDETAIETAYLAILTRRPRPEEMDHFRRRLEAAEEDESREQMIEDLCATLINTMEFSWNH